MLQQRNLGLIFACLAMLIFAVVCYEDGDSPTSSGQAMESDLESSEWYSEITSRIQNDGYRIREADNAFEAFNPSQGFNLFLDADGLVVLDRDGEWSWNWTTVGYGRDLDFIDADAVSPELELDDEHGMGSDGEPLKLLTYDRGEMLEWYSNHIGGVEQGFEISERPLGNGPLIIKGEVGGDLTGSIPASDDRVVFSMGARGVLQYHSLLVTDSAGREIDSWMDIEGNQVSLVIVDSDAAYPLFVDPGLSLTPDWTFEPDEVDARLGWSVSSAGDVNNDGYDDAIVGAHFYDNGQANEGRAFVFHGSASGLSATADWTAESDQAYSYFGRSVSGAGDVTMTVTTMSSLGPITLTTVRMTKVGHLCTTARPRDYQPLLTGPRSPTRRKPISAAVSQAPAT